MCVTMRYQLAAICLAPSCVRIRPIVMRDILGVCVSLIDTHCNILGVYVRMTHCYVRHGLFICATCLIHMCDVTFSHVRHGPFICETWLSTCATGFIHVCDMPHSYLRHDPFSYASRSIHLRDMTHLHVHHVSFIHVATFWVCTCHITHILLR